MSIHRALEPLFGERVRGRVGGVIDALAIVGTASQMLLVILTVVITFIAMMSVISGVGAGMKWLSNINLSMAGLLLICVLLLGPTLFLFQNLTESVGYYLANFFGIFIARISRGRTIRQFVIGTILMPTIVGMLWFSIMGGAGPYRQFFGTSGSAGHGTAIQRDPAAHGMVGAAGPARRCETARSGQVQRTARPGHGICHRRMGTDDQAAAGGRRLRR